MKTQVKTPCRHPAWGMCMLQYDVFEIGSSCPIAPTDLYFETAAVLSGKTVIYSTSL